MASTAVKLIDVRELQVDYTRQNQRITALKSINLSLRKGEFGVIIGPSGCGKSTLLHILAGLKQDYEGKVEYDGNSSIEMNKKTALILQDYGLLPWKTVAENVGLGLQIRGLHKKAVELMTNKVLEQVGIPQLLNRYPAQLSGGQRQRVAIARALALQPELLLMDEPFSALDALTREELQDVILDLWKKSKMTLLLVTHSIEEAVFLGQKIFVMSPSPGTLIERVSNHMAGDHQFRGKQQFYELCNHLRSLLQKEGSVK